MANIGFTALMAYLLNDGRWIEPVIFRKSSSADDYLYKLFKLTHWEMYKFGQITGSTHYQMMVRHSSEKDNRDQTKLTFQFAISLWNAHEIT